MSLTGTFKINLDKKHIMLPGSRIYLDFSNNEASLYQLYVIFVVAVATNRTQTAVLYSKMHKDVLCANLLSKYKTCLKPDSLAATWGEMQLSILTGITR